VFTSVPELTAAIEQYVAHHNANPKPFIWTATARDIQQKVIRANSRLSGKQNATLGKDGCPRSPRFLLVSRRCLQQFNRLFHQLTI
jgi:hypothetical protein